MKKNEIDLQITTLFEQRMSKPVTSIEKLPQAGSDRAYFRVHSAGESYIATYGKNLPENNTFLYFSEHFTNKGLPVPHIFCSSADGTLYIQEDAGHDALLTVLEREGLSDHVFTLYKNALTALATLQVKGDQGLDYSRCLTNVSFGKEAILADLLYFKYYFLDTLKQPYDKQLLLKDFEGLAASLADGPFMFFMFRDFQSRNVMIGRNDALTLIDYQGGMKGAPQYDVASMLWQAKAGLSDEWKKDLLEHYISAMENALGYKIDVPEFTMRYNGYVLIRLLQVLGAYGFRGLFEQKAHFVTSIPFALQNLAKYLSSDTGLHQFPALHQILETCASDPIIKAFTNTKATEDSALTVHINSFSYIKNGYPPDPTKNGGGFVFDCRSILNPGRQDEYKTKSGEDKPVMEYLDEQTKMPVFLRSVFNLVDISVEDYLQRDFESLMINFGCTGGQHRSVYAANALARHLKNKFKVKVEVCHINKDNWRKTL